MALTVTGLDYNLCSLNPNGMVLKSKMKTKVQKNRFPPGWDEKRVCRVMEHYESKTEEEAVAEDEASYENSSQTFMEIPNKLVPKVRELIAKYTR